jgi:RNA-directed DNA polymerase
VEKKIRETVKIHKTSKTDTLIALLNPIIRGWANHYRHVISKQAYTQLDNRVWECVWKWAKRRHPNKTRKWIVKKYFTTVQERNWVFTGADLTLVQAAGTPIKRHIKIKAEANPYDLDWEMYFEKKQEIKWRRLYLNLKDKL